MKYLAALQELNAGEIISIAVLIAAGVAVGYSVLA